MVGGVNAAATFAVLPLGALWLLTRTRGPRRRAMMLWWPVFILLGTLWWLIPLFLLGAYSPPFLDFIESARCHDLPDHGRRRAARDLDWVPYVDPQSPAALDLLREYYLILNTGLVVVAGLAGLALARNPHRRFLAAGVFTGVLLVTMGHTGSAQGLFADGLNNLLDGALAPLRNVHKFDPVLRLPLVVGLAFALEEAWSRLRTARTTSGHRADRVTAAVLVGSVTLAVLASGMPLRARQRRRPQRVPGRAGVLEADGCLAGGGRRPWRGPARARLVFGTYVWGEPRDEPMQALAGSPWAVRNAVPLVPAGNIRMLNAIEDSLAQGVGGPGLTKFLARAGISHIVVRNDLVRSSAVAEPVLVHQAVEASPGLDLVAEFGPEIGAEAEIDGELGRALINGGWQATYASIEVYSVEGAVGLGVGVDEPTTVIGGPEDLLSAGDVGAVGTEPTILAPDADPEESLPGPLLMTDGLRLVERNFGALHDSVSPTLSGEEPWTLPGVVHDYDLTDQDRWATRSRLVNATSVTASSSQSDPATLGGSRPGALPYAAVDGELDSAWVSSARPDEAPSWRVDFGDVRDLDEISVALGPGSGAEQLRVRAADWESPVLEFEPGETRTFAGPGPTDRLWIEDESGRPNNELSISEVTVPGPAIGRELVLPEVPGEWGSPDSILLRRVTDGRDGCAQIAEAVRCRVGGVVASEEPSGFRRRFSLPSPAEMDLAMTVAPRGGPDLSALVLKDQPVSIRASATALPDPRSSAIAMIDGDPGTTWLAPPGDIHPSVEFNLLRPQRIRGLALSVQFGTAARRPQSFKLTWPGGSRTVRLGRTGAVEFPPIVTSRLRLEVEDAEPATDLSFSGPASDVPIGIGELRLDGVPFLPLSLSTAPRMLGCGSGPTVSVDGEEFRTAVSASPADLLAGQALPASLCARDSVALAAGVNSVAVTATDAFVADSLLLGSIDSSPAVATTARAGAATQSFGQPGTSHLATRGNVNPGWTADVAGQALDAQVFDGWRQGWRVSGDAAVEVEFAPDRGYRLGLVGGLLAFILLVVGLAWPVRGGVAQPALAETRGARRLWLCAVVAASVLCLGWIGGLMGLIGVAAVVAVRRRRGTWEGWAFAGLLVPAFLAYVVRPWGGSAWAGDLAWPSYVAVLALSAVGSWVALGWPPRGVRRINGRSTSR